MGTCNQSMNHDQNCSLACNQNYVIPSGQTLEMNCYESNLYNGAIVNDNVTYPSCVPSCATYTCENGWTINESMQNQPCLEGVCTNEYCCTEPQPISQHSLSVSIPPSNSGAYSVNVNQSDFELNMVRTQIEDENGTLVDPVSGFRTYKFFIKKINQSSIVNNIYTIAGMESRNNLMIIPPCYRVNPPFGSEVLVYQISLLAICK